MISTIHLVRHGRVHNPDNVIYGRLPGFHLSEIGERQARAAAERLRDGSVGGIWSSPMERAQQTAAAIARFHPVDVVTDERLTESATTLEGVGRSLLAFARSPSNWWKLRNPLGPSWGESFRAIEARVLAAVYNATAAVRGKDAVIVSHQTPILVARLALAGRRVPPWLAFAPCETGSITTLVLDGDRLVSASYFAPPREDQ